MKMIKMKVSYIIIFVLVSCSYQKHTSQLDGVQQIDSLLFRQDDNSHIITIFLDPEFTGKVDVFEEPKGGIIKSIQNNLEEDDIVMFDLLQKTDSMYYVIAYSAIDDRILAKGWIYQKNKLGIYSAAYGDMYCSLYEKPSNRAKVIITEKEYNPNVYQVLDFEGKWLKIKAKINGKKYVGWIPPEEQCCNVYSTCN